MDKRLRSKKQRPAIPQFCFAKLRGGVTGRGLVYASHTRGRCHPLVRHKGLQRKAHRKRIGASEDLQRKARFFAAAAAKNVPYSGNSAGGYSFISVVGYTVRDT
jgi:hypothetical protein